MDVIDIYKSSYEQYKEYVDEEVDRYTWAASQVFGLVTYDEKLDREFVSKIFDICGIILRRETYDYIRDSGLYKQYIIVCQLLYRKQWINWGTSIKACWFDDAEINTPDYILDYDYWHDEKGKVDCERVRVPFSTDNLIHLINFVQYGCDWRVWRNEIG